MIRSLRSFRLTGGTKDYIVLGSDSGRIVIVEYNPSKNFFERVHHETYGKSGCRRIIPGQYLAVDPKGRAIMIGAVEKQKLVYIMNRDAAARLTISSPLEAHKGFTIVYDILGLDVGFDNPVFACLEFDYEDADSDPTGEALEDTQQTLTFYELDLGLNHVVRKQSDPLETMANKLIGVPGGSDGPGGVIVCFEGLITYRNLGDQPPVSVRIPRRSVGQPENRGTIITAGVMHKHKHIMFFLLQTDYGDLFKLTLDVDDDEVKGLTLKYFDTAPVASGLVLLKRGYLFVGSEFGDHVLYQVAQLGTNEDEPPFSTFSPPEQPFEFTPRGLLNLRVMDELENLAPITSCQIADLAGDDSPQVFVGCGQGARSSIRTLRHGLEVSELAQSPLPGSPSMVWTVKQHITDQFDSYIVVSFLDRTLVLSIGESVEEVHDSGFLASVTTLSASLIGDDAMIQIYPDGIRHIKADKRVNEWKTPGKRQIVQCAVNERQVAIVLEGQEIVYFEMDASGQLNEYTERMEIPAKVVCMSIASVPEGLQRSQFLAIGCEDNTVRVVSLDPVECLQPLSMQALPAQPLSLCVLQMSGAEGETVPLHLNIGLENGVLLRTVIDDTTGDLSDTRTRYLGAKGVRLFQLKVQGGTAVIALSSRPWLSYTFQGQTRVTPLSYELLEYATSFASENCPEGIVAIAKNSLRVLSLGRLGTVFNTIITPVRHTPRKFVVEPMSKTLISVEGDHNVSSKLNDAAAVTEGESADNDEGLSTGSVLNVTRAGAGLWTGAVRVVDPLTGKTLSLVQLAPNEVPISVALVPFTVSGEGLLPHVIVGVVKGWCLKTQGFEACYLDTYRLSPLDGVDVRHACLTLVHRTVVDALPSALHTFHGRVLVGVGKLLRLYDLGKRKLLKKCENRHLPNTIVSITSMGHRIVVSDLQNSFFWVKYNAAENLLVIFADDTMPRWLNNSCMLDYSTVAGVDKFGNVAVARLPANVTDDVDEDPTGSKALWDRGLLNGASQKLESLAAYHIGETALSVQRATLTPGGSECLVYTTLAGAVGALVPFTSKEDVDFFQHLEMHLRVENPPLCGRDHLAYRSSYFPAKNVIDGDLCEMFNGLQFSKKKTIAEELDRTPAEVSKKLEDIRNRYAFG